MSDASQPVAAKGGSNPRQTILLGVLVLLGVALAYDYKVARPSVNAAYDKIAQKSMQVNSKSTEILTNLGVRETLGMEPSDTFEEANGDMVEVFAWRSGLPIRTHKLFTVYKKNGDNWLFHRHTTFIYESSAEVSKHDTGVERVVLPEESEAELSDSESGNMQGPTEAGDPASEESGDESEGGAPPAPAGGTDPFAGSSAFDPESQARAQPEQVFSDNDEDGDGKLAGPEVPQISTETRVKMDKDGDGVLTREEWMAEFGSAEEPASNEGESDQAEDGGEVAASEENDSPESSVEASSEGGEATTSEEAAE